MDIYYLSVAPPSPAQQESQVSKFIAVELSANRNPADDRPLLRSGQFGTGSFSQAEVAEFASEHSALNAATQATNARAGATVEAVGRRS